MSRPFATGGPAAIGVAVVIDGACGGNTATSRQFDDGVRSCFEVDLGGGAERHVDARRTCRLALQKAIDAHSWLASAVSAGSVSLEAAGVIAKVARDDDVLARELLRRSPSLSVDELRAEVRGSSTRRCDTDGARRERLRRSQYLSVTRNQDNMIVLDGLFLPEVAAPWLTQWNAREQEVRRANERSESPLSVSAARAEGFSRMISESTGPGSRAAGSTIAFHVDLTAWERGWAEEGERCEIAGIGPVPLAMVLDAYDHSALRLLVTSKNKLLWYSEESWRDRNKVLPEFIKRAAKAAG